MFSWLQSSLSSVVAWWLVVTALGWVVFPFVFRCMPLLPDRGFGMSKFAALVLLAFFQGWVAFLFHLGADASPWGPLAAPLWALLILLGVCLPSLMRNRSLLGDFLRGNWRLVAAYEAAFAVAFFGYLWMRSFFADATFDALGWYGAEKWVNLSYLTSLWRNPAIPPSDPWLAGASMNYYYFSHLIWASLTRLTGAAPQVGFNLGLGTLFGLLLTMSFSTGWALCERKRGGVWAMFLIALAGPAATWRQLPDLILGWRRGGLSEALKYFDFWGPSDVLPHTRNEFPAFNWLLGDLHAHATGLLLLLLALCLIAQLQRTREVEAPSWRELVWDQGSSCVLLLVVMAAMWMTNSWDLAVLGLLGIAWIKLESFKSLDLQTAAAQTVQGLLLWAIAGMAAVAVLAGFFTHHVHIPLDNIHSPALARLPSFLSFLGSVGIVGANNRSPFLPWLSFWGLFGVAFIILGVGKISFSRKTTGFNSPWLAAVLVGLLVLAAGLHNGFSSSAKAGLLLTLCLGGCLVYANYALRSSRLTASGQWVFLLGVTALACLWIPEFFYLDDPIGPPNQRYNTVFKLYFPAWTLLALSLAAALSRHRGSAEKRQEAGDWRLETEDRRLETENPKPLAPSLQSIDFSLNGSEYQLQPEKLGGMEKRRVRTALPSSAGSTLSTQHSALSTPHSALRTQHSALSTQHSALYMAALWLIGVGTLYPLLGVPARIQRGEDRLQEWIGKGMDPAGAKTACRTLDGLAFLNLPRYAGDDLRLGLWMRENIPVQPPALSPLRGEQPDSALSTQHSVLEGRWVAEAPGTSYSFGGRFAAISGIPCILAWQGHESQWRGYAFAATELADRAGALDLLYTSQDDEKALSLCHTLGVGWVAVGSLERRDYPASSLARFGRIGRLARQFGASALYEIPPPDGVSALDKPPAVAR